MYELHSVFCSKDSNDMRVCIFEDNQFRNFYPLTYTRPVYDLRCGCMTLAEKIQHLLSSKKTALHTRHQLSDILRGYVSTQSVNELPDDDILFVNGRLLLDESLAKRLRSQDGKDRLFVSDADVVAAHVARGNVTKLFPGQMNDVIVPKMFQSLPIERVSATLVKYPWELVHHNPDQIERDFGRLKRSSKRKSVNGKVYAGANLLNRKNIIIGKHSVVKPGAVLDAEKGPIVIGENVHIMPNAVIEGPTYVGDNSVVKVGAKIYHGNSFGPHCKVGGEIEASIIQGYSNKQHDGFLGHSYLGSWINLGADTNTSDLKNTYGTISVQVNGALVNTDLQFVGLTMGDHSKSGINVMFDTGTVVGVSCNIYGAGLPPKFLPSFSWGSGTTYTEYQLQKSLETARRVMARRGIEMTQPYEEMMRRIFAETSDERHKEQMSK